MDLNRGLWPYRLEVKVEERERALTGAIGYARMAGGATAPPLPSGERSTFWVVCIIIFDAGHPDCTRRVQMMTILVNQRDQLDNGLFAERESLLPESLGTLGSAATGYEKRVAAEAWRCPYEGWSLLDTVTGLVTAFDCKSWSCIIHGRINAYRWRTRLGVVPWSLMLTLTLVSENREVAASQWLAMRRWLKARGMRTYLRVLELGEKNGMRHWHILVEGIEYVDVDGLREASKRAGLGERVHAMRIRKREAALRYVVDYLTKSLGSDRSRTSGWRRITTSRNISPYLATKDARMENMGKEVTSREPGRYVLRKGG